MTPDMSRVLSDDTLRPALNPLCGLFAVEIHP